MKNIKIVTLSPTQVEIIENLVALLDSLKNIGVFPLSFEEIREKAEKGYFFVALDSNGNVAGCAGMTDYGTSFEFGSWVADPKFQKRNNRGSTVANELFIAAMSIPEAKGREVLAVCNKNSARVFYGLGYRTKKQTEVDPAFFNPCQKCSCPGKNKLHGNKKCVDTFFVVSSEPNRLLGYLWKRKLKMSQKNKLTSSDDS